jgi:hypothetical protein
MRRKAMPGKSAESNLNAVGVVADAAPAASTGRKSVAVGFVMFAATRAADRETLVSDASSDFFWQILLIDHRLRNSARFEC